MGLESLMANPVVAAAGSVATAYGDWRQGAMARDSTNYEAALGRDFSAQQAQIQRGREDTAHQREVADLSAAGLNPILSGTGGGGLNAGGAASSGGASSGAVSLPDVGSSVNSAFRTKNVASENAGIVADNRSKAASATVGEAQAAVAAQIAKAQASTAVSNAQAARFTAQLLSLKIPEAMNTANLNFQIIQPGVSALGTVANSAKDVGEGAGQFIFNLLHPSYDSQGTLFPRGHPKRRSGVSGSW